MSQTAASRSVMADYLQPQVPLSMEVTGKNTGVGCHFLLQGIFLIQGSNLALLHCRHILYCLSHSANTGLILQII